MNAGFGFVIRGSNPARVEQLEADGAAENAGLLIGDAILKINGIDVRQASHTHLIKLLQGSGSAPTLLVAQHPTNADLTTPSDPGGTWHLGNGPSNGHSNGPSNGYPPAHQRGFQEREEEDVLLFSEEEWTRIGKIFASAENEKKAREGRGRGEREGGRRGGRGRSGGGEFSSSDLGSSLKTTTQHGDDLDVSVDGPLGRDHDVDDPFRGPEASSGPHQVSWATKMFKEKLEYHLTKVEQSRLKKILEIYWEDKNIVGFMEHMTHLLDTKAKRSLWAPISR